VQTPWPTTSSQAGRPPQIVSSMPSMTRTTNITATISDEGGIVGAWVEITNPVGGKTNTTLNSIGDNYWLEQPYGILGNYNYVVSAVDIVSRWAIGSGSFSIVDTVFPIADAGPDQDVTWATVVIFDGSGSWDNFGISSYMWTFNDQGLVTLTGVSPSYQFFNPGTFVVTLTVTDYSSNSDTDTMNVTVRDITPPRITNVSATPSPQNIGGFIDIKATVRDNVGVAGVWIRITDPYGFPSNVSMPQIGVDEYSLMQSYSVLGTYSFEISATDSSNNWNKSSGIFEIKDLVAPIFISVSALPNPQEILYSVQISANIQDNIGVLETWVEITEPDLSFAGNFSMTYDSGQGIWRRNFLTSQLGLHYYTVFARDPAGNWNNSNGQFFVQDTTPPTIRPSTSLLRMEVDVPFNFTAMASDNFRIDEVFAELESPTSQIDNYSMNYGVGIGTNYYLILTLSELGDYQVNLSVKDIAGNWGIATAVITVVDSYPPTAEAGPDQYVTEGDLVQFDGSGSTDSHAIESYEWRFVEDSQQRILYGPRPVYTYSTAGTYDVTLIVTDYAGGSDSDSLRVFVNPKTTGDGDDDQKGLWDTIVNDVLIHYYWIIILLMTVLIVLIVSVAAKRRSDKKKARARAAARARQRARMEAEAQAHEVPPPPDDELPPPPSEEDFAPPPPPPT